MNENIMLYAEPQGCYRCARRKLPYQQLPKGAMLLIDTSNMVAQLGFAHVARHLSAIADTLATWGYRSWFVWELHSYRRTIREQKTVMETCELATFAKRTNVALVDQIEADLVLLQMAQAIKDSVIVTLDRYRDYAATYPDIVRAARRRPFSAVVVDGQILLTIVGLKNAIVIPGNAAACPVVEGCKSVVAPTCDEEWILEVDEDVRIRRASPPFVVPCRCGLMGAADGCIRHGDVRRGYRILSREAEKNPVAYHDIAEFVEDEDGNGISHSAAHFDWLADRGAIKLRDRIRRIRRQSVERRRLAYGNVR